MRKLLLIFVMVLVAGIVRGQEVGRIGGVEIGSVGKLGLINIGSVANIAGIVPEEAILKNCKEIKEAYPEAVDGIYSIDPDGEGGAEPFECYCDMTTDGGGWTLVGYYRNPATENAPDDLDNRDYAYFMKARNDETYGKPEYIANPDSEGAWTDWRVLSGVAWPLEFAVILDQSSWSTGWDEYAAKVIYRVKNRNIMPNYGTTQDLTSGDNLYFRFNFTGGGSGWADVGSSSNSDTWYWYPRASSNNYLILFHESNNKYINNGEPTNNQFSAFYGIGVPGGNSTWHHSARLLIR